jgi:hypothetical protein
MCRPTELEGLFEKSELIPEFSPKDRAHFSKFFWAPNPKAKITIRCKLKTNN